MIRLNSTPTANALLRLQECSRLAREAAQSGIEPPNSIRNCYRHIDVKTSIVRDTAGKCAYCESKITHVYWGDVEHIKPKDRFPEQSLDYDNLTLACAICNNNKSDYYNEDAPILHPYVDNPEEHVIGLGSLLWHRNGSCSGQRTIDLLELNREALLERRLECLQRLSALADRYVREPNGPIKSLLKTQLRNEVVNSSEFALVARSFLRATYNFHWDSE
jgi:uncharacterized protein (TIGR02646 family)